MTVVLGLVTSLLWGTSDFLGGMFSRRRSALVAVAWSEVFALVLCSVAVLVLGSWHGPVAWLWWGAGAGAAGGIGIATYYAALGIGTMGVVAPIASLGVMVPVIVGLTAGEAPSSGQLVGMAAALVGILFTSGPELKGGAGARSVLLAVLAGVMFGLFFLAMDQGARVNTLMTLWMMRATVVTFFVGVALVRRTTGAPFTRPQLVMLLGIAVGDLTANLTFGLAANSGYLSIASLLSSLYPVVTVLLARFVLSERLQRVQIVGVAVTMVGVAFISAG